MTLRRIRKSGQRYCLLYHIRTWSSSRYREERFTSGQRLHRSMPWHFCMFHRDAHRTAAYLQRINKSMVPMEPWFSKRVYRPKSVFFMGSSASSLYGEDDGSMASDCNPSGMRIFIQHPRRNPGERVRPAVLSMIKMRVLGRCRGPPSKGRVNLVCRTAPGARSCGRFRVVFLDLFRIRFTNARENDFKVDHPGILYVRVRDLRRVCLDGSIAVSYI